METLKRTSRGIDAELAIGFGILFFLLLLVGGYGIYRADSLAELTNKMYHHPLAVSNRVRDIKIDLLAMHRSMKDVALARNEAQLQDASRKVDLLEQDVLKCFALVQARYLGDKSMVNEFKKRFTAWKNIRQEVIAHMKKAETEQASAITRGKGAAYVAMLEQQADALIVFAKAKGGVFHARATRERVNAITAMSVLLLIAIFVSFVIAFFLNRSALERKSTQTVLQFTQIAVDQASDSVFWVNSEAQFIYVNEAAWQRLGYTRSELLAMSAYDIASDWTEEAWSEHWCELKAAGSLTFETGHQKKDGSILSVEVTANFLTFSGQEFNCAIVRDITEKRQARKMAGAELARLRNNLVRVTKLAAIGQVSASIAHDIRNPLGVIRNAVFYLKRNSSSESKLLTEYLQIIDHEVSGADKIIRNLLALARQKPLRKREVELGALVRGVFAEILSSGKMECELIMVPERFIVQADSDKLLQVFRNLLQNAIEALDGTGKITVNARHGNDDDIIMVHDTGSGVAAEVRSNLFEPLITTKVKGTGLGLTICAQIVAQHNGKIELVKSEDSGEAFCLRLPRKVGADSRW